MSKRRIAIIGLGMAVTPHAKSLLDLSERIEVAYVVGRSLARLEAFKQRFPFPMTDRLQDVLDDETISAVMILTPPNTHLELVQQCAAAGKHILLEKPLDITLARSVEAVEVCTKAGVTFGVVLQHRFRPASLALADMIASGVLGRIAGASVSVRWWRPQSYYDEPGRGTLARDGGGVLLTQAIHTLDLFLSLTGQVAEVAAFSGTTSLHRMETEDIVSAALRFPNGAIGALDATSASYPGFPERIEIIGEKATVLLVAGGLDIYHQNGKREHVGTEEMLGGGTDPMDFPHDTHLALITDFFDALDQGRSPRVSGTEALKVHQLIDALLKSSTTREPVQVG